MAGKRHQFSFAERMRRIYRAGLKDSEIQVADFSRLTELKFLEREKRLEKLLYILKKDMKTDPCNMIAFILYDIESNRIRRYISKYLERQGYVRIQRSVFFGNVSRGLHHEVCMVLKEVNEKYDNGDSIVIVPISLDMFHQVKVIGKNLSYEMTIETKSTLFL